ncbi:MAG: hypothetical protein SO389_08770 [Eubacterium sp.]|nr:hypothetical protein [Eubacterium sp.]
MTAKKKRLLFMVLGVCLCALIAVLIGERAISDNKKEYAERCSEFAGIWTDKDKTISLEIQRVTSEAIFFSLDEKNNRLFSGRAVGDETYEFTYNSTGNMYRMSIRPGTENKLTIQLLDKKVRLNFPGGGMKKQKPPRFNGMLTKKTSLVNQKAYSLSGYLGTKKEPARALNRYCSFSRLEDGTIWRVHTLLDETGEYFKTDLLGITMNSTLSECKRALGRMISEQTLVWKGIRRQYENDKYVSTIVTNEFGVIIEMDCQLKNLPGAKREGEFILKGNSLYRFAGDYTGGIKITIPAKCNRISSHAFDAGEYGYSLNEKRKYTRNITIPQKVFVEEDAFALGESTDKLRRFWQIYSWDSERIPVRINTLKIMREFTLTYIGDNAFWGIDMDGLPPGLTYLGTNYTVQLYSSGYDSDSKLALPVSLKKLKFHTIYLLDTLDELYLPDDLEILEDDAIFGGSVQQFVYKSGLNKFKQEKTFGQWIRSKDGSVLCTTNVIQYNSRLKKMEMASGDFEKLPNKYYEKYKKNCIVVKVPEGVKEIWGMANLSTYDKVILPKSLKKVNVGGVFSDLTERVVFLGDKVPEFTGECDINPGNEFEIRVKKGLERKMLRALKKHFLMSSDTLKRYITTF